MSRVRRAPATRLALIPLAAALLTSTASAAAPPFFEPEARIDLAFAWDTTAGTLDLIPGTLVGARNERPGVDLAAAGGNFHFGRIPLLGDVSARVLLGGGDAIARLHDPDAARSLTLTPTAAVIEAWLSSTFPVGRGLVIDAGIFPAHIGFEGFLTRDNWNASHAWMSVNSPFYNAGVRVRYAFTDHVSAMLLLLNGWNLVDQDSTFSSGGAQVAWAGERASATLNLFAGPTLEAAASGVGHSATRFFGDLVGTLKATPQLTLAASFDAGVDLRGSDDPATWYAAGVWLHVALTDWLSTTLRSDLFDDRDAAVITGHKQLLAEATLTEEVALGPLFAVRLEGRVDRADVPTPTLSGRSSRELLLLTFSGKFGAAPN